MRIEAKLMTYLFIGVLALFSAGQAIAADASAEARLSSIVITFDAPIVNGCNQAGEFYNLLVSTIKSPANGITEQIRKSGALWSASHSLCGIQLALYHFNDPGHAVQICKDILVNLGPALRNKFTEKSSSDFADYIHSLPAPDGFISAFQHKPVTISLSENMLSYAGELTAADELGYFLAQTSRTESDYKVLPGVEPTAYTVFCWPENSSEAFFTAKYLGEKFIREASLDNLLKYEIVFGDAALSLVVYLSGSEELLAEHMSRFNQINKYRLGKETPTDWLQFSRSLSEIIGDDLRDVSKRALFDAWQKHWHGTFTSLQVDLPVAPKYQYTGICMPEAHQHLTSFSNEVFPTFAAACHANGGNACDITIAIGGGNLRLIDEIHDNLTNSATAISLTLVRDAGMLKIIFHCNSDEVSGNLARIRNHIYNNLVEKGLISEPVDVLRIGIAGVSGLPPFELRGLMQKGWVPVTHQRQTTPLSDLTRVLRVDNSSPASLHQRWQLYLASNRGRSELLAMIAAAGHSIKDFAQP